MTAIIIKLLFIVSPILGIGALIYFLKKKFSKNNIPSVKSKGKSKSIVWVVVTFISFMLLIEMVMNPSITNILFGLIVIAAMVWIIRYLDAKNTPHQVKDLNENPKEIIIKQKNTENTENTENEKKLQHDIKIAVLMKDPYKNLEKIIQLHITLLSPIHKIFELLLQNGIQKNSNLSYIRLETQIKEISNSVAVGEIIHIQEEILLNYIISLVNKNRTKLTLLDKNLPVDIFTLDQKTISFLKEKISEFSLGFIQDLKYLEKHMHELVRYNIVDKEILFVRIIRIMPRLMYYKRIDNICLLSLLSIAIDNKFARFEISHTFTDWARQYDKVYLESFNQYKKQLDVFNADVLNVITHNYEQAHHHFMKSEAKTEYIEYIKGLIDITYSDPELLDKQNKADKLKKL